MPTSLFLLFVCMWGDVSLRKLKTHKNLFISVHSSIFKQSLKIVLELLLCLEDKRQLCRVSSSFNLCEFWGQNSETWACVHTPYLLSHLAAPQKQFLMIVKHDTCTKYSSMSRQTKCAVVIPWNRFRERIRVKERGREGENLKEP